VWQRDWVISPRAAYAQRSRREPFRWSILVLSPGLAERPIGGRHGRSTDGACGGWEEPCTWAQTPRASGARRGTRARHLRGAKRKRPARRYCRFPRPDSRARMPAWRRTQGPGASPVGARTSTPACWTSPFPPFVRDCGPRVATPGEQGPCRTSAVSTCCNGKASCVIPSGPAFHVAGAARAAGTAGEIAAHSTCAAAELRRSARFVSFDREATSKAGRGTRDSPV
jgi:hypothetical protein